MLNYPDINPVAFQLGPIAVHWYGLSYLFGFTVCWGVLAFRIKHSTFSRCLTVEQLSDVLFYSALGTILGGRIGYMLFYAWSDFIANPLLLFQVWKGGMSFHGGMIGVILALWFYARKMHQSVFDITDLIAPGVPIGLGAGRIGNFINGELWGRITDVPWAMVFPNAGPFPRHPSQLYEFLLEGVLMFVILWTFSAKPRPRFAVSALFLICYGCFRFFIEFFREPDQQIGFMALGWLTRGQFLSLPMIIIGVGLLVWAYTGQKKCSNI